MCPKPGSIHVGLSEVQGGVEIRVSDNGRGIPEMIRGQLFEPFVSHGKENGTGLGLTVVQKIVQDHGGDVIVEKTSAEGTVFRLLLPLASSSESCAESRKSDPGARHWLEPNNRNRSNIPKQTVRLASQISLERRCKELLGTFFGRRIVKHKNSLPGRIGKFGATGLLLVAGSILAGHKRPPPAAPQSDAMTMTDAVRQLQDEVRELRNAVVELRSEAGQYRAETEQLRKELQARGPRSGSGGGDTLVSANPSTCGAVGRTCCLSGRIFPAAEQQAG